MKQKVVLFWTCIVFFTGCNVNAETLPSAQSTSVGSNAVASAVISDAEKQFSRGEWQGQTFVSDFLTIAFEIPQGWRILSDDEMNDYNGTALLDLDNNRALEDQSMVWDMMVTSQTAGTNVSIAYENLVLTGKETMDAAQYLQETKDTLTQQYETMSFTCNSTSIENLYINDRAYNALILAMKNEGVTMERTLLTRRIGDHMALITITTTGEFTLGEVVDCLAA